MKINKPAVIRQTFRFLVDEFSYSILRDEELFNDDRPFAFVIQYVGNNRRVHLSYDYKENFFYFQIIREINTQNPKDSDPGSNLIFWKLFKHFEPSLELKEIQPNGQTCEEAALVNAQFLRKYASSILRGEEWI